MKEKIMIANWAKGIDWCVEKIGTKWCPLEVFGNFPLYNTKKAAFEAVEKLILSLEI